MTTTTIPIYRQYYAGLRRNLFNVLSVATIGLIMSYTFLVIGSTAVSSKIKQLDKETALLQSSIATLEVEYFTQASNIGPDDVSHLAMRQVPEDSISYLVLEKPHTELASAR